MNTKLTEAELADCVVAHLQDEGWSVYPEVAIGKFLPELADTHRVVDLVALRGTIAMAVELKLGLGFTLFEQAAQWTALFPLVAVAVPGQALCSPRLLHEHLFDHFGLGVASVYPTDLQPVRWRRRARLHRSMLRHVPAIAASLSAEMRLARAGAKHTYRHSPYQETFKEIRIALAQHGPLELKLLLDYLRDDGQGRPRHHYSSTASLRSSVLKAIHGIPDGKGGIHIAEPDIVRDADGRYIWTPALCRRGPEYADRLMATASRRTRMKETRSA